MSDVYAKKILIPCLDRSNFAQDKAGCRKGCRFRLSVLVGVQRYGREPKGEKLKTP